MNNINDNPSNPNTVILSGLLKLRKGIELIAKGKEEFFTKDQKEAVFNYIKENQHIGKEKRVEHKEKVKAILENKEAQAKENLCPKCKSPLVLRQGKFGEFYGCSKFPICKYTQKC